jgi:hypothetical protein
VDGTDTGAELESEMRGAKNMIIEENYLLNGGKLPFNLAFTRRLEI